MKLKKVCFKHSDATLKWFCPHYYDSGEKLEMVFCYQYCFDLGGFQLLDLIIPELKSHMIPYKFKVSHWWKINL